MTSIRTTMMIAAGLASVSSFASTPAAAAPQERTWVSPVGSDLSPNCTRLLPCRTFASALSKTVSGGQITCLESGGFGAVTIDRAVSIVCDGVDADVLVTGTNGIVVQAGPEDVVYISGIDVSGLNGGGYVGIQFLSGAALHLRNVSVHGFNTYGIDFYASQPGMSLFLEDVYVSSNGNPGTTATGGMRVLPFPGGTANVTMARTRIADNRNVGLRIESVGVVGGTVNALATNSAFTNSGVGLQVKAPAGTSTVRFQARDSSFAQNSGYGILANGAGTQIGLSRSEIVQNGTGLIVLNTAQLLDNGGNVLRANTTNGSWTLAP